MLFRQLFDKTSGTYTYLLADSITQEALLIDPVKEHIAAYLKLLQELNLRLTQTLDTHVHADHITASGLLQKETGCKILAGRKSQATGVDVLLDAGDKVHIGGIKLEALYTPGHTDDSYSFYTPGYVFTGDTLLIRGTGRTDFQHGSALQQYDSIFNQLFKLPDETLIYPGHDYNGMTVSSIREEKKWNPRLQVQTAKEYAELMSRLDLPKPALIDVAVPANLNCGREPT